jgi:hypothetical protein
MPGVPKVHKYSTFLNGLHHAHEGSNESVAVFDFFVVLIHPRKPGSDFHGGRVARVEVGDGHGLH